jgi:hypothetical protein
VRWRRRRICRESPGVWSPGGREKSAVGKKTVGKAPKPL